MRCPSCGHENADDCEYCASCGIIIPRVVNSNPFAETNAYDAPRTDSVNYELNQPDPVLPWLIPVGQSVYAVIAGYAGLLSLGCCPLGPIAVLFGILAIADLRRNPEKHGMLRAIVGIVLGSIGFIFLIVVLIASFLR